MNFTAAKLLLAIDPAQILVKNGMPPDPWQADVLRKGPKRALVCWGRQSGKSVTFGASGLHRALFRPGSLVLIASFNHDKAKDLLRKAMALYEPFEHEVKLVAETTERAEFANGSVMLTIPARPGSARGPTAHMVILDEAAWTTETLLSEILYTLSTTDGPLIALSTPPEQPTGWWWATWTRGGEVEARAAMELHDGWYRSLVPSTECPRIGKEFLDFTLEIDGPLRFAREALCEFPRLGDFMQDRPITPEVVGRVPVVSEDVFMERR